ncbi:MAG: alpha/beta hydrolase-fold protein [Pirellulales bacterium]
MPRGEVTEHTWQDSKVFPDTIRRYYVYVPAQYRRRQARRADGLPGRSRLRQRRRRLPRAGRLRQPDPPGCDAGDDRHLSTRATKTEKLPPEPGWRPSPANRSFEYDTLSGDYAEFLISEIIPEVGKSYQITDDPDGHAICGISSGGICAFTVAWQRPDQFRKVLSHVGSFTNIRGGDAYPGIIRKTDAKPIRVFLQDGSNDLDNEHGNWPLGNKQMFAALEFKDYDVEFVYGEGAHQRQPRRRDPPRLAPLALAVTGYRETRDAPPSRGGRRR